MNNLQLSAASYDEDDIDYIEEDSTDDGVLSDMPKCVADDFDDDFDLDHYQDDEEDDEYEPFDDLEDHF